jgi:hypothetical protein
MCMSCSNIWRIMIINSRLFIKFCCQTCRTYFIVKLLGTPYRNIKKTHTGSITMQPKKGGLGKSLQHTVNNYYFVLIVGWSVLGFSSRNNIRIVLYIYYSILIGCFYWNIKLGFGSSQDEQRYTGTKRSSWCHRTERKCRVRQFCFS